MSAREPVGLSYVYLGLGAIAVAAYHFVGPAPQTIVWDALGYSAVAAIVGATLRRRPTVAAAWYLFAAAVFCNVTGDAIDGAYAQVTGREVPLPYYSDVFSIASYVLLVAGVVGLAREVGHGLSFPDLAEAGVYAAGVALLAWDPLVGDLGHQAGVTTLGHAVLLTHPAGDVLVLAVLGLLAAAGGWRHAWVRLLAAGLVSFLVADVLHATAFASYSRGSAVDTGWLCAYVLFGAAALQPHRRAVERGGERPLYAGWRRAGLVAAILAAIGLIFEDAATGETLTWAEAGLTATLIGLVVLRLVMGMRDFERANETERAARSALEQSHLELAAAEERFRSLAENATDVILRRPPNLDDPYDYVSPAIFPMTGYTPQELCTTPGILRTIVHPDDIPLLAGLANTEVLASILIRWIRKDGGTVWTDGRGSLITDEHGAPTVQAVVRDVTERVLAEEELRRSGERFRNVVEQSFDAVSIVDAEGVFRFQNRALTTLLGYEVDDVLGTSASTSCIRTTSSCWPPASRASLRLRTDRCRPRSACVTAMGAGARWRGSARTSSAFPASTASSSRAATSPSVSSPTNACVRARSASGPRSTTRRSGSPR